MTRSTEELRRLERAMFRAWPAFESIELDGWVLRFADGYTKRANSINPHFGSTRPVAEKIADCEARYAERGLPTIFRLTPFSRPPDLDRTLAEAGYRVLDRSLVMAAVLDRPPRGEAEATPHPDDVAFVSLEAWLKAFDELRRLDPARTRLHREIVKAARGERKAALIERDDRSIACGLGVQIDDRVGLFDLFVCETARRRGLGAAIVAAILRAACRDGARTAFLQVHSENTAAQSLYRRFGFDTAYPYWYRIRR